MHLLKQNLSNCYLLTTFSETGNGQREWSDGIWREPLNSRNQRNFHMTLKGFICILYKACKMLILLFINIYLSLIFGVGEWLLLNTKWGICSAISWWNKLILTDDYEDVHFVHNQQA